MFTRFYINRRIKKYMLEWYTNRRIINKSRMLENIIRVIPIKKRIKIKYDTKKKR